MLKRVRDSFNGLKEAMYNIRAAEQEFLLTQQGEKVDAKGFSALVPNQMGWNLVGTETRSRDGIKKRSNGRNNSP